MLISKKICEVPNILYKVKLEGHQEPVEDIKIFKGYLISGSRDKMIRVWDLCTGECKKILEGHENTISAVDMNNKYIASGSYDKTIRIWDKNSGECLRILRGHTENILDIKLKGNTLISCSEDQTIKVWDISRGDMIKNIPCHNRKISALAINKNKLISASWDHTINVWDMKNWNLIHTFEGHGDAVDCVDSKGNWVVSGDQANKIFVWDLEKKKKVRELNGHSRTVMDVFLEGNILYSCSKDRSILLWDINTGNFIRRLYGHSDAVLSVFKQENCLASASADSTIRIWDDNSLHSMEILEGHLDEVLAISITDGKLISTGKENILKIWDLERLEFDKEISLPYSSWVWGLASEKSVAITSSDRGTYYVIDLNTGNLIRRLEKHNGSTYRCALKNNIALTSSWDNTAKIWDVNTGRLINTLKGHTYAVYSAAIISNDKMLTGSSDATIKVWNRSGKCLRTIKGHLDEIFHIACENGIIVSASADKTTRAFEIETGKPLAVFTGHKDQVLTVQIKNGIIFSGSLDHTIKIWDLEKGICLKTLEGHSEGVKDLAIYKDKLISSSYDHTIRIWNISEFINKGDANESGKITVEQDTLISQIQSGTTYNLLPEELYEPDIIRLIYGLHPLDLESIMDENLEIFPFLKQILGSWRILGHIGHAPWLCEIYDRYNSGTLHLNEDEENLKIILDEFRIGLTESENLYWLGILRTLGENPASNMMQEWDFDLEFSGQGPAPLEGFNWTKLGPRINELDIEDRTETALVFKLTLNNVSEWFLPLIKSIRIQMKSDRGDIAYVQFNSFIPDQNGNWSDIAMFKIDSGYRLEPIAIIDITDIDIEYDPTLKPDFKGSEIIDQINLLMEEQNKLSAELTMIREEFTPMINSTAISKPYSNEKNSSSYGKISKPVSLKKGYSLDDLKNSPEAMNIFTLFKKRFSAPRFGTLKVHVGEGSLSLMDKFLEFIEPKIIFFSTGGTIASLILLILTYAKIFNLDLLGASFTILDDVIPLAEIIVYGIIYGFLVIFLLTSILAWFKYQKKKKSQAL